MRRGLPPHVIVPLIVACAFFMENLDATVIATALPAIAASLDADPLRLNLAITAYLFGLAAFIPASGWLADRFGARTVFRLAIALFTASSVACGFAESVPMLVAARFAQGVGGAMMSPVGRLVVLRTVEKSELVRAMAWVTVPALIGPVIGPPVGGFITTFTSWRWIFWMNVPIGLLGIALAGKYIPEIAVRERRRFDAAGFLLCGIALASFLAGLETAGRGLVPVWVTAAFLAGGALVFLAYILHARRIEAPILDLSLLRLPTFRSTIAGGFVFRSAIGGLPFLLPLLMQLGFGLSAFASGLITFSSAAGALLMKLTAAPILDRFGFRRVLVWNAVLGGTMLAACALFRPGTPAAAILAILLVGGFFRSLQFTAINTLIYADVPDDRLSRATSFVSMVQQIAVTFGVVVAALFLHVAVELGGGHPIGADDFPGPFLLLGLVSVTSALVFLRLPAGAGDAMRRRRKVTTEAPRHRGKDENAN